MNDTRMIHRQAMDTAEQAFIAQRAGKHTDAQRLFREAFTLEVEAARLTDDEPGRSILHRSAATLALHAQLPRDAEKIAAAGLAGDPPPEVADELRDIMEQIASYRQMASLDLSGDTLRIVGELVAGDALNNSVRILDDNRNKYRIEVTESLAESVVRPYFGTRVVIHVARIGERLLLRDINPYP